MDQTRGPRALVYKTKADYSKYVPILLNSDKTEVISFPDPKDLKIGDQLSLPTKLNRGYLLDNRGIGKNVAFLNISYSEYAALEQAPKPDEIMKMILDRDPLVALWDCGLREDYKELKELKQLIRSGFVDCQQLK